MNSAVDHPQIGPVPPPEHTEALRLVFSRLPAEDRTEQVETLLADAASGAASVEGLLGARSGGRLVGAVFSQIQPGKTAAVHTPRIIPHQPATTAEKLLDAACDWLNRRQVHMVQVLLRTDDRADHALLRRGGFDYLADLLYLVSLEGEFPTSPPKGPLQFEAYYPENHRRLARLVDATYQQTLDCPRLNGVRQIEDVLAGYRATGVFDPNRWLIVRHQGRDVGCLLLADHPRQGNWELVYMGLVPSARGHGWGIDITRQAQWLTRRAGRPRLVLAVDAENHPAVRMYALSGFQAFDRRGVYLRLF